jgi:hypothetical protein
MLKWAPPNARISHHCCKCARCHAAHGIAPRPVFLVGLKIPYGRRGWQKVWGTVVLSYSTTQCNLYKCRHSAADCWKAARMLTTHASQIANVILSMIAQTPGIWFKSKLMGDGRRGKAHIHRKTWVPALPTTCRRGIGRGRMPKS